MSTARELAYRYELFIAPVWRERFDAIVDENVRIPDHGRILEVNCGTGAYAIEVASRLKGKGEVVAIDPDRQRVDLAVAKAQAAKVSGITFECGGWSGLPYAADEFDAVIGDASMLPPEEVESLLAEMIRVAKPNALVVLKLATHGSFDEFFSIYWEALHDCGLDEGAWEDLKRLIESRGTVSATEEMAGRVGLKSVHTVTKKEEFQYEEARAFLEAPLIEDSFLSEWLGIVPKGEQQRVRDQLVAIIERERHDGPFEVSIKATVVAGVK